MANIVVKPGVVPSQPIVQRDRAACTAKLKAACTASTTSKAAAGLLAASAGTTKVATVFDLMAANLGIDRGLGGANVASSYDDASVPGDPAGCTGGERKSI